MRRKLVFLILSFFCCSLSFAKAGLGASASYSVSTTPTYFASFTARSDISPWCVSMNAHLDKKSISFFLDNWFINERISSHLDYYVLWGVSFGAVFDEEDDEQRLATGSRLGAGLDFFFFNRQLEFFMQAVCDPYYGFKKDGKTWKPFIRPLNFPCTAGIRLYY